MAPGIVCLTSGGIDSTTMLYWLRKWRPQYLPLVALSVTYGQKHNKEVIAAEKIANAAGAQFRSVDISGVGALLKSALTRDYIEVPKDEYTSATLAQTVVPSRNLLFLALAAGLATSLDMHRVAIAVHAGDHPVYPDCRPAFLHDAEGALQHYDRLMTIFAPFKHVPKEGIVLVGLELGVPFELTWSCYEGNERPCLRCSTCVERTKAFMSCHTTDPALSRAEWSVAVSVVRTKQPGEQLRFEL